MTFPLDSSIIALTVIPTRKRRKNRTGHRHFDFDPRTIFGSHHDDPRWMTIDDFVLYVQQC